MFVGNQSGETFVALFTTRERALACAVHTGVQITQDSPIKIVRFDDPKELIRYLEAQVASGNSEFAIDPPMPPEEMLVGPIESLLEALRAAIQT